MSIRSSFHTKHKDALNTGSLTDPSMWQSASRDAFSVCRSLTLPLPTFVGLLMFLSLVALSGLEFLVDEMFGCELQRRLF